MTLKTPAPYFINPDIEALPDATGDERTRLMRRIAACVGDESALRTILGLDPAEFAAFYPDMLPPELSTDDTISSFISRFSSEQAAETPEIESIVAAPAIDYASTLDDDDETDDAPADDETSSAIDAFLQAVPPKTPARRHKKTEPREEHPAQPARKAPETPSAARPDLSEALFALMVKNKNYTKALEIITELSLNNPKKSVYFAYQMRFLKKLIKNQENIPEKDSQETAPTEN